MKVDVRSGLGLLLMLLAGPTSAQTEATRDLHAYWHDRCLPCHAEAGAFARSTLAVVDGRLVGRHHRADLDKFLHQHYLAAELVAPVTAMLSAQTVTAPVFKEQCGGCHGSAAEFARQSLIVEGGVLKGRKSATAVANYLGRHGGLAPADVPAMVKTLERVVAEVGAGRAR
jgi:mono/diheme cytochrome c family protein